MDAPSHKRENLHITYAAHGFREVNDGGMNVTQYISQLATTLNIVQRDTLRTLNEMNLTSCLCANRLRVTAPLASNM